MPLETNTAVPLALREYGFPIRVPHLSKKDMQGLAMSRSFGDNVSKPVGVTHVP